MSFYPAGGVTVDPGGPVPPSGPPVPPPPPGPGAAPPFAAPPTERDKRRTWIGLGIGAVVLVLFCVGGAGGIGVVLIGGVEQSKDQARATVTAFLDAIERSDPGGAHTSICDNLPRGVAGELVARTNSIDYTAYRVGEPRVSATIDVPVVLSTQRGDLRQLYVVGSEGTSTCIVDILAG